MNPYRPVIAVAASLAAVVACSENNPAADAGSGGATGVGGAGPTSGGATGVGGAGPTSGGATGVGGAGPTSGGAGPTSGGAGPTSGGATGTGGAPPATGGANGTGGGTPGAEGPCDIYGAAGQECVAAYSMVRRLYSTYTGPLYQVRSGSSEYNIGGQRVTNPDDAIHTTNGQTIIPYTTTPEAGELHDIAQTTDGFGDAAAQDAACGSGTCTIATIYDQSGHGNHLTVAKGGLNNGGNWAALDDFETIADAGPLTVGGRSVYSLYMEARQGYRMTSAGDGMPLGDEPTGMYMLADGTHAGGACCWDFGNVTPDPTMYAEMNTLMLGIAYWGRGAGNGPWYGADFEAGVWMGGSVPSDPGWGGLNDPNPTGNPDNPSLQVKLALGFLKTRSDPEEYYSLRMANAATDTAVNTAWQGPYPQGKSQDQRGAVVIGVGGDNSNNSYGTFFEGVIVAGYPEDATEQAVLDNIKAVGYPAQ